MKHSKLKLMLAIIIFSILVVSVTSIFATNEKIQILQKANEEYMIYIQNHLEESFEFAFSNDKNANKEELSYRNAATDTAEEGANYIAGNLWYGLYNILRNETEVNTNVVKSHMVWRKSV